MRLPTPIRTASWVAALLLLAGCPTPVDDDDATGDDDDTGGDAPWFCADAPTESVPWGAGVEIETPHYRLRSESGGAEASTIARLLEAAWGAQADWFDATPTTTDGDLLVVEMYATAQGFYDAIEADGLEPPIGAGGYFHTATEKAYFYGQPTIYFTRQLAIHESVHQFHHLSRIQAGIPGWYSEGHAEHLSHHDWDGECARIGRLPMVTLEDTAARAWQQTSAGDLDLDGMIAGTAGGTRPLQWAATRFLDTQHHDSFTDFRDAMDAGADDPVGEFEAAFAASPSELQSALEAWLADEQQPMSSPYAEWLHVEPGVVIGWSEYLTMAPVKEPVDRFSVTFDVPEEGTAAGAVIGFDDTSNYLALLLNRDGSMVKFEVTDGDAWWSDVPGTGVPTDGAFSLTVEHGADAATVSAGGDPIDVPRPFTQAGGTVVNAGEMLFGDIAWK